MDLGDHDDDLDESVPVQQVTREHRQAPPAEAAEPVRIEGGSEEAADNAAEAAESAEAPAARANGNGEGQRDRGWRSRRRRRSGRRQDRDDRTSEPRGFEPRMQRPPEPAEEPESAPRASDSSPSRGYQPIMLPGESLSKYRRAAAQAAGAESRVALHEPEAAERRSSTPYPETEVQQPEAGEPQVAAVPTHQPEPLAPVADETPVEVRHESESLEREEPEPYERVDEAVPSGGEVEQQDEHRVEEQPTPGEAHDEVRTHAAMHAAMEEEEIDEEEAELSSYADELEEDAAFEEMEEETHAADHEIAARGVQSEQLTPEINHGESVEVLTEGSEEAAEEEDEEEAAIEEAQAQAEALVSGEPLEGGMETRAEVSTRAGTSGYTQRTQRSGFDRRRGRRGGGGRRFKPQSHRQTQSYPLISELLKEGQEILVQIAKEPIAKKGARITSHIALPGRFLVFMPTVNHTGVSRKIASDEERQRLKRIVMSERENGHGGFIVRTAAQNCSEEELRADIRFLKNLWNEIKTRSEGSKAPALIYHDLNVVERVLRDQVTSDFSAIWVDSEPEYERVLRFANRFQPALIKRVKLYTKETPLYDQFGLTEEIDKALKSKVWLKSGGYIVINQTEALVAIDINTGKYVGKTSRLEDTIVKTNVDAIKEIVRQIRLRDLGGIIVIDFIDMDERRNRQRVMQALEDALRADRAPSKVLQFNDFGLVAITRKRVKQSLERTIGASCPYCTGTGYVKSVNTVCNEIYVEMRKLAKHLEHSDVMLRVNPEVAKALKANNARFLNEIEELTKRTVIVKSDPALHQEQFDVN
jgi:ribonuclease G